MLHIEDFGRGSPSVLLLHGMPTPPDYMMPVVRVLEPHVRVLLVHLPGYGHSAPLAGAFSLADEHTLLETRLTELSVKETAVVGFSAGAYRAFDLALRGRVRVTTIVSLAGFARLDAPSQAAYQFFAAALRRGDDLTHIAGPRFLSASFAANCPEAVRAVESWLSATPAENLAAELDAMARAPDLLPRLATLRCKVVVRTGDHDAAVPIGLGQAIARNVPGSLLQVVQGAGHALLIEDEQGTVEAIRTVLV